MRLLDAFNRVRRISIRDVALPRLWSFYIFKAAKIQRRQARLKIARHGRVGVRNSRPRASAGYRDRRQKIESRQGRLKVTMTGAMSYHTRTSLLVHCVF